MLTLGTEVNMEPREGVNATRPRTSHAIFGSRRCAMRVIQSGRELVAVYEQDPVDVRSPRLLVFETPGSSVCLDAYPQDWNRMADDALLALRVETKK